MADDKAQNLTDTNGPDTGPAPTQTEQNGPAPAVKQEPAAPEVASAEK